MMWLCGESFNCHKNREELRICRKLWILNSNRGKKSFVFSLTFMAKWKGFRRRKLFLCMKSSLCFVYEGWGQVSELSISSIICKIESHALQPWYIYELYLHRDYVNRSALHWLKLTNVINYRLISPELCRLSDITPRIFTWSLLFAVWGLTHLGSVSPPPEITP